MTTLLVFCLGYVWGKKVQRNGSWGAAGSTVIRIIREFLMGLSGSFRNNS